VGDIIEEIDYVRFTKKKFKPASKKLKTDIYKDEKEILYWFVHKNAKQKIDYYDKRISEMEKKYKMDFSAFKNKIHSRIEEKNLEEWNDFVLWVGYLKAYSYWEEFC